MLVNNITPQQNKKKKQLSEPSLLTTFEDVQRILTALKPAIRVPAWNIQPKVTRKSARSCISCCQMFRQPGASHVFPVLATSLRQRCTTKVARWTWLLPKRNNFSTTRSSLLFYDHLPVAVCNACQKRKMKWESCRDLVARVCKQLAHLKVHAARYIRCYWGYQEKRSLPFFVTARH